MCILQVTLSGAVEGKAVWPKHLKPVAWHDDADRVRMKLGLYHKIDEVHDGMVEYRDISVQGPNGEFSKTLSRNRFRFVVAVQALTRQKLRFIGTIYRNCQGTLFAVIVLVPRPFWNAWWLPSDVFLANAYFCFLGKQERKTRRRDVCVHPGKSLKTAERMYVSLFPPNRGERSVVVPSRKPSHAFDVVSRLSGRSRVAGVLHHRMDSRYISTGSVPSLAWRERLRSVLDFVSAFLKIKSRNHRRNLTAFETGLRGLKTVFPATVV